MPFRIQDKGINIEVDTATEFKIALLTLRSLNGSMQVEAEKVSLEPSHPLKGHRDYGRFYQSLGDSNQAQMLRALRQKPEGMIDRELCAAIGIQGNMYLGGVMGGISKNAQKEGFSFSDIIIKKERKAEDGKRGYHYKLNDNMLTVVPGVLL